MKRETVAMATEDRREGENTEGGVTRPGQLLKEGQSGEEYSLTPRFWFRDTADINAAVTMGNISSFNTRSKVPSPLILHLTPVVQVDALHLCTPHSSHV